MTVAAESVSNVWLGCQRPGLLHLPEGAAPSAGDALYLLGEWGFGYDDWQQFTMASTLREQADGRWAAKEVGLELPRQNGKGELLEGRECLGLFFLGERKLIHSAHEFATASEALDRMDDRIGSNPQLKRLVKSVKRSHGEEGVYLKDGRKVLYRTRTASGGRGFGADFLALDEAMFLAQKFLGSLMPVISARRNPQMWYAGSPVDQEIMEHGVVFSRLRDRALRGEAGRMAYFGWSPTYTRGWATPADVPREATKDPQVIAEGNPALGIRIDLEHVVDTEREAMDHRTFCVERLAVGDWPRVTEDDGQVISIKQWLSLTDLASKRSGPVVFVYDVAPDRQSAAVAVAGRRDDGLAHVEVAEHKRGTGWVVPWLAERVGKHQPAGVFYAQRSPAASLAAAIEEAGVQLTPVTEAEHAEACGLFFDAVGQRTLRHLGTNELVNALRGAVKRPLGDSWAWSRKSSKVDISPLVAATLAHWASQQDSTSVYATRGVLVV